MNIKEYQKQYKQRYKQKNKIITFPLHNKLYEDLTQRANYFNLTTNSYVKKLLIELWQKPSYQISIDKERYLQEYINISNSIANNINNMAHKVKLNEQINIASLIQTLMEYEQEFKKFIKE